MKQSAELGTADAVSDKGIAAELARIREQRAELARRREAREAATAQQAELEAEARALADEQAIEAAVDKHGPLGKLIDAVSTDMGVVIVQRPSALKFRRFQDKGSMTTEAVLALVRPCVVHPSMTEFDHILDELPATLPRIANAVVVLCGQRADDIAKK